MPISSRFRRALVTGGAGFIGSHLVDELVARGVEVTVLDDLSSGSRSNLPSRVSLIEADVGSPDAVRIVEMARPDLVIHAAAQISVPASVLNPARDRHVNLVGTENVVRGAAAAGTRRIVFISSGGAIYGEASQATEETRPAPQNPYGVHKLAAESYVRLSAIPHGIVRFSNVYGARQQPGLEGGVVAMFLDACRDGRGVTVYGDGEQTRDFLSVMDAVSGTMAVAHAQVSGTWNVATGQATSIRELLRVAQALAGTVGEVSYAPPRVGDVRTSSLSAKLIGDQLGWAAQDSLSSGLRATLSAMGD